MYYIPPPDSSLYPHTANRIYAIRLIATRACHHVLAALETRTIDEDVLCHRRAVRRETVRVRRRKNERRKEDE